MLLRFFTSSFNHLAHKLFTRLIISLSMKLSVQHRFIEECHPMLKSAQKNEENPRLFHIYAPNTDKSR